MDLQERFLTTMEHEEPDRVPILGLMMEPSNSFQSKGESSTGFFKYLKPPIIRNVLRWGMNRNWIWNRMYYGVLKQVVEVSIKLGFDSTWLIYMIFKIRKDKNFPLGVAWSDPWGRVWKIKMDKSGNADPYYVKGYCNTQEKWEAWIVKNSSLIEKFPQFAASYHSKMIKDYGDQIYIMSFVTPGVFENSWQPIGFIEFIKFIYEKPKFIERVVEFHTDQYLKLLEAICKLENGNKILILSDDLGHKTGPLLSPSLLDRFFGNSYKKITELAHKMGKKVILHSCGNTYKLLEKFIEWGFDGIHATEPTAGMDLEKVRKIVGHQLVLVGNLDVSQLLVRGTRKEIEDAVKHAVKVAAPGGGYILSPAHNHEAVDPKRLQWMIEATHEFGKYPINF